jgi:hypothetical protein
MQTTWLAPASEQGQSVPRAQGGPYRTLSFPIVRLPVGERPEHRIGIVRIDVIAHRDDDLAAKRALKVTALLSLRSALRELPQHHRPNITQRLMQYDVADAFDDKTSRGCDRNISSQATRLCGLRPSPAPSRPAATANLLPAQIHRWTAFRLGPSAFPEVLGSIKCAVLSIELRQSFALR